MMNPSVSDPKQYLPSPQEDLFTRTRALIGLEKIQRLQSAHVAVIGLGGVGSWCAEALVRSGVGQLTLVDGDVVAPSNVNRQLPALPSTVGQAKTALLRQRFQTIRPETQVNLYSERLTPDSVNGFFDQLGSVPQIVIDAIDDCPVKFSLVLSCAQKKVSLLMCGGCGRRLDPSQLELVRIEKSFGDPLLKKLRSLCRVERVDRVTCLFSKEPPRPLPDGKDRDKGDRPNGPSSMIFVPASAGLLLASEAVLQLTGEKPFTIPRRRPVAHNLP